MMRQGLGVYAVLVSLASAGPCSLVAAQAANPASAPPAGSQPAAAPAPAAPSTNPNANAPVDTGALQPSAAAAAPPAAPEPGPSDTFNLTEALRGGPPLTSLEAAKRAAQTSPTVAHADAVALRAQRAAEQAFIAVYPRLEAEARYTRVSPVTLAPDLAQLIRIQTDQFLFVARMNWPVSAMFFTFLPRYEANVKLAESQGFQIKVASQAVKLSAREAYYNYARARAALMVAKATVAQTEAHRKDSDALVSAGSIARVELMRAEAQVASAKVSQTRAENAVAIARSALFTLLHQPGDQDITISENIEDELPMLSETEDAIYKRALGRRSELKALAALVQAQNRSIAAANGQALPVVSLGGLVEEANPNQRYFGAYKTFNGDYAAYASLVWSPNDTANGLKAADVSRAELAQTQADLGSLKDQLRTEVSQAYNGYQSAKAALDSARVGIAAAEESYRVRREQFRAGAAIAVDVIDAESQVRQARLDLVNTLIDLRVAKARLDRAVEAD